MIFLSYAHHVADECARDETRAALAGLGVASWCDLALVERGGAALNAEIAGQIEACACFLSLLSGQSLASPYCQAEIVHALEHDKPILRVDIEALEPGRAWPNVLLPLKADAVTRHRIVKPTQTDPYRALLRTALVGLGVPLPAGPIDPDEDAAQDPFARIIRPAYRQLCDLSPDRLRSFVRRLVDASTLAPDNGYNRLSLAFLHLQLGDSDHALADAERALVNIPTEADAHYALALAYCRRTPPSRRNLAETEHILRILARGRRLDRAGAHLDLLSASVIANHYLPRYLSPPASIEVLIGMARSKACDPDELRRVRIFEPILPGPATRDAEEWIAAFADQAD